MPRQKISRRKVFTVSAGVAAVAATAGTATAMNSAVATPNKNDVEAQVVECLADLQGEN